MTTKWRPKAGMIVKLILNIRTKDWVEAKVLKMNAATAIVEWRPYPLFSDERQTKRVELDRLIEMEGVC